MDSSTLYKRSSMSPTYKEITQFVFYNARTLWLFTYNDIKTTILPSIGFTLVNSIAFRQMPLAIFASRLPYLLLWIYLNLLAFTTHNQRYPNAIAEDRINKPWRPLPSGRITPSNTEVLGRVAYALGVWVSLLFGGGTTEASVLVILGYLYNDLGGSGQWAVRNLLNALGITIFLVGSFSAAMQAPISADMVPWFAMIAAIIGTTIHTQDMHDQPGDAAAGRKTLPLVVGDGPARWMIAVAVLAWSIAAPLYWNSSALGYLLMGLTGVSIAARSLTKRTVEQDRTTFTIYNVWLVAVYCLPMISAR